jgi:ribosomal protein L37AE/L43A
VNVEKLLRNEWPRLLNAACVVLGLALLTLVALDWQFTELYPDAGKPSLDYDQYPAQYVAPGPSEADWLWTHMRSAELALLCVLLLWMALIVRNYRSAVRRGKSRPPRQNFIRTNGVGLLIGAVTASGVYLFGVGLLWVNHQFLAGQDYMMVGRPPFWESDHDGLRWWLRIVLSASVLILVINWLGYLVREPCSSCRRPTINRARGRYLCDDCQQRQQRAPAPATAPARHRSMSEWSCPVCGNPMVQRLVDVPGGNVPVFECSKHDREALTLYDLAKLERAAYQRGFEAGLVRSRHWRSLLELLSWPPAIITAMTFCFVIIMTALH